MMNSCFKYRLKFLYTRISLLTYHEIIEKIILKLIFIVVAVSLQPIALLLHLLNYRNVDIFTERIGHLALEPDCLFKEVILGKIKKRKWIFLKRGRIIANQHLLKYWICNFITIDNSLLCYLFKAMSSLGLMSQNIKNYARKDNQPHEVYRVYSLWKNRKPLLELSRDDKDWGDEQFNILGIPSNSWYACLHVREKGYSDVDESIQSYRNADIRKYLSAIQYIVSKGGWVVRMGSSCSQKLPDMLNVVDYAHSKHKSERLDVVLCARARFVLGSTSGLCIVSTVFGVPVAIANCAPPGGLGFNQDDISIPKKIFDTRKQVVLSFDESLASPASGYRYALQYTDNKLELMENTEDEILSLAREMLERLSCVTSIRDEDDKNKSVYALLLNKNHYSYHSIANVAAFYKKAN